MAVQFVIPSGAITLAAATAKEVIEVASGANHPPEWLQIDVSSGTATAGILTVEVFSYTGTGTGTTTTPKRSGQAVGVAESTAKTNLTAEGAGGVLVWSMDYALPFNDHIQFPYGRELFQAPSTWMGIRLTSTVAATFRGDLWIEE